jgi:hypothetical protein
MSSMARTQFEYGRGGSGCVIHDDAHQLGILTSGLRPLRECGQLAAVSTVAPRLDTRGNERPRFAHPAVEPSDDELLGRCNRCRSA